MNASPAYKSVTSQAYHSLISMLMFGFPRVVGAPSRRLPLGRCACHEPTVRWCGRHGEPLKRPLSSRV
jgi:hypothetical protein